MRLPLSLEWRADADEEAEFCIRAVYLQVLDHADEMASKRLAVPEAQWLWGELSMREFVSAVVKLRSLSVSLLDQLPPRSR